jgi:hypothetical protein
MTRTLSARRLAVGGAALALTCGTLTVATAVAPSAFAATCSGSGTSSNLSNSGGNGVHPVTGTQWTIPSGCGTVNITLTKSNADDSFAGWLFDSHTDRWSSCSAGFVKYSGKTITLCTGVLSTTKFAVVQESNTRRDISVGY